MKKLTPTVKNYESKAAKIKTIQVILTKTQDTSNELASLLRGYDEDGNSLTLEAYNTYLKEHIQGIVLNSGATREVTLSLGLDTAEQGMQQLTTSFRIVLDFEQNEVEVTPSTRR